MPTVFEQLEASRQELPELFPSDPPADAKAMADAAVAGDILFYRREPIHVGRRNIDWSGAHKNHQEWRAQLNRFFQLEPLMWLWRQTGEAEYAAAARDYIEDWLDAHEPYDPAGECATGDSTLNMSVRLGNSRHSGWLSVLPGLADAPAFDAAFAERMVEAVRWQIDWLAANPSRSYNWRIANLDCLLTQGLLLPERLGAHRAFAIEGLNVAFGAQILPDGAHVERSAGYNNWMCHVFLTYWRLGRRRADLGLHFDDAKIARMDAYRLHLTKPNAEPCRFNDASGRLDTNETAAERLEAARRQHQGVLDEAGVAEPPARLAVFPAAGHVFYRTGWDVDATWWAFDAGGWGGGHTHLSRLSVELHTGRRTTLPDPGIFDYEMSNPFGPAGKSTPVHSTMTVGLGNQANVDARLLRAAELPGAVVAWGQYAGGYWPGRMSWGFHQGRGAGTFGVHDRMLVWLPDRALLVLDCLVHEGPEPAHLHWLINAENLDVDDDALGLTTRDDVGNLRLRARPLSAGRAAGRIARGEKDPYLGWLAGARREMQPAPLLQVHFEPPAESGPTHAAECATVLAPFTGAAAPEFTIEPEADEPARRVTVRWADGDVDEVYYTLMSGKAVGRFGPVCTDAPVVVRRRPAGGPETVGALDATFLEIDGREVAL